MGEKAEVLYVDDEEINLQIFELNLKTKYKIHTALSGIKAIRILESNPEISIVVSDMKMPIMNGIEFIKLAKEQYPVVVFYILTGFEITKEIQEALNAGLIQKYFRKPFNMNEMEAALSTVV